MSAYSGLSPSTGERLTLPRTPAAEAAARALMAELGPLDEGRMFGVLLVEGGQVLRAGSGAWSGAGWVPPLFERLELPGERETVARLAEIRAALEELGRSPVPARLRAAEHLWHEERLRFAARLRLAKELRDWRRGSVPESDLVRESRADKHEKRHLRAREAAELAPLRAEAAALESQRLAYVRERRQLSRELQARMHAQVTLAGEPWSLASLFPNGPPTGVGECCAPKLLGQAARLGLRPLAMAEFWWGPPRAGRAPGQFYTACKTRCQPLLGALLSGPHGALRILYEDGDLVAVDKPPGVLSVPGRASWAQDSVQLRLSERYPDLKPVHRLDLETSGVLVLARNSRAQAELQQAFARREVTKVYEAVLEGAPAGESEGEIDLPLGPDPSRPGCYRVDPQGKPALTRYRVLAGPRVEFQPVTGRSHQLRIHARDGLGLPIVGDRLYGTEGFRLLLHCRRLELAGRVLESTPEF